MIRRDWFKDSDLLKQINALTGFLPSDAPLSCRVFCILNDIATTPTCPICGTPAAWKQGSMKGFAVTCGSRSCVAKHTVTAARGTKLERYGDYHSPKWHEWRSTQSSDEFTRRLQNGTFKKYGVTNASTLNWVQEKRNATVADRYGVANIGHLRDPVPVKLKQKQRLESLGNINVESVTPTDGASYVSFACNDCSTKGNVSVSAIEWRSKHAEHICPQCGGFTKGSIKEAALADFIVRNTDCEVYRNNRMVLQNIQAEVDVWIPELKLAIEFNGLYWHSEDGTPQTRHQRNRHLVKTEECEKQGIQLIHVFENEWDNTPEIVKSRILNKLGMSRRIYARHTTIVELSAQQTDAFMRVNHIQGPARSSVAYGLIFDGELVAAMSFCRARYTSEAEWELLRMASKQNTVVVGGAGKLFKHFTTTHNVNSVVSYADRRWSVGTVYQTIGFVHSHNSKPNYFYFNGRDSKLHSRVKFQKHKLSSILEQYDATLSESANMFNNGYRRIWDCGNMVWIWKSNQPSQLRTTNTDILNNNKRTTVI